MNRPPRDYQIAAVNAVTSCINQGYRDCYYALPTGCGKTRIITMLVELYRKTGRVLVIAHRKELIQQTAASIRDDIPGIDCGIVMAEMNEVDADVIVGTWQSLTPTRLETVLDDAPTDFSLILIDEAHHAINGSAYERIIEQVRQHSPRVAVVGCTATPFRSDSKKMQDLLPECAFMRSIPEMQQGGWLSPLKWKPIKLSMDLSKTGYSSVDGDRDFNQEKLYEAIQPQTFEIVARTKDYFASRPACVFAVNIQHAHELAAAYNLAGITSMALSAHTPRTIRQDTLDAWKSGKIQCVVNVALFTEGFDYTPLLPNRNGLGVVVIAAPTMSPSRYLQMIGRGTRLKPSSGDFTDCIVLDCASNANLLETKQITLPRVMPTLQEDVFEVLPGRDLVEFDGVKEVALGEIIGGAKKPTLLRVNDPLATSWIAWGYNRLNNVYYAGLSSDREKITYAAILPTDNGLYRAFVMEDTNGQWNWYPVVERGKPLQELMHHINHVVASNGAKQLLDKKARWRKEAASPAQLGYLASLSPKYYELAKNGGWNKGELAAAINWCKLMPQLKLLVQELRLECCHRAA